MFYDYLEFLIFFDISAYYSTNTEKLKKFVKSCLDIYTDERRILMQKWSLAMKKVPFQNLGFGRVYIESVSSCILCLDGVLKHQNLIKLTRFGYQFIDQSINLHANLRINLLKLINLHAQMHIDWLIDAPINSQIFENPAFCNSHYNKK